MESAENFQILVVDDEEIIRNVLSDLLAREGYTIDTAVDGIDALEQFNRNSYDLVITDLTMPRLDGMGLLKKLKESDPELKVIVITAYATLESAVSVIREGAYDYIVKPFIIDEVLFKIRNIFNIQHLSKENLALRSQFHEQYDFSHIIGKSRAILGVLEMIKKISVARSNVLITGESGTGKELVARAIHTNSPGSDGPFLGVNCGAIPENLLESELFGYKKGAFTGAFKDKEGMFIAAGDGSIFLDEIGEMPIGLQIKLLRALEERAVQPVGSHEPRPFSARIISATNKNLLDEVEKGNFREDLFYRLNVVEVKLPPLRERQDDIPLLVRHFLDKKGKELNLAVRHISSEAMQILERYQWRGNIRELENTIERAMILSDGETITASALPRHISGHEPVKTIRETAPPRTDTRLPLKEAQRNFELRYIEAVLQETDGDKKNAAERLGISLASLYRKLESG